MFDESYNHVTKNSQMYLDSFIKCLSELAN